MLRESLSTFKIVVVNLQFISIEIVFNVLQSNYLQYDHTQFDQGHYIDQQYFSSIDQLNWFYIEVKFNNEED
jgi:hypothetical protein